VVGVDAVADNLREASRLAARKPARGGTPNALFGRMSLEQAPGALAGLAHALTVHLPWGSLLRAVALAEPEALARLRALCRPGASVRIVFGYEQTVDGGSIAGDLPPLTDGWASTLERRYGDLGWPCRVRPIGAGGLVDLPTTWAGKLAHAGRERRFLDLHGRVAR
jgi:16S rRNA (adenine(1408)-N(1))-methyltransferase